MAPPKQGIAIQVRIPRELLDQIDYRREQMDMSRSEMIRRMLKWAAAQPLRQQERV